MSKKVAALRLSLHGQIVGYVAGYLNGPRNVLSLDPQFSQNPGRPTLTLSFTPQANFERVSKVFPMSTRQQLHPMLSNLLPEGALREVIAQGLKVHQLNEFPLLAYMGLDLPGALVAEPVAADEIPDYAYGDWGKSDRIAIDMEPQKTHFSLAGVQMKFSMRHKDGRYILSNRAEDQGDWIIKTPSTTHAYVPLNEYTSMQLAGAIGVNIPEIELVEMDRLDQLPAIKLPDEQYAFAIKRFDRSEQGRIHTEDFAQVTFTYAAEKYEKQSYEDIARLLYRYAYSGQKDAVQMAIRLLANILLANGDAHKKNWSLIYPDRVSPHLAPAYDIVSTRVYMRDERDFALSLAGTKQWYDVTLGHFEKWAKKADIPFSPIKYNLSIAMDKARANWPLMLAESPMLEAHKKALRDHWRHLNPDFRIET